MSNERRWGNQSLLVGAGIVLILVTGLIHLVEGPGQFSEVAYVGFLFFLNAVGAVLAAVGIYRGARLWGWGLGLFVASGALLMYTLSRTVGLPGLEVQDWLEPIGVLSLLVEGLYVVLGIVYLTRYPRTQLQEPSSPGIQRPRRATS